MQNRTLKLTLKKKWFDLIKSGVKLEEYREIKDYWIGRLIIPHESEDGNFEPHFVEFKSFTHIQFTNGYSKTSPTFTIELLGISVGRGNTEWGAPTDNDVFILKLGKIIEHDTHPTAQNSRNACK